MPATASGRTALLTLIALVAFAGNSILCRLALAEQAIDPWSFTAVRLLSGALLLLPYLRSTSPTEQRWSMAGAGSLLVYALAFSLAYVSLAAGTGALLLFGTVQFTMIAAGLRAGERPTVVRAIGILVALGGIVWLVLPGLAAPDPVGALLMVLAGIAWGTYSLLGRGTPQPTVATARNFVLSAPVAALLLCFANDLSITSNGLWLAIASGALTSGVGYVIWYAALRGHTATSAAIVQLSVPLIASVGGIALLGEAATPRLLGAGTLTIGGVAIAILSARRR